MFMQKCHFTRQTAVKGGRISWVGSFPRTKWEVFSGTKIYLIWILSVIFEFNATFWLFGTKYLNFGADILIFGAKIPKSCLFKVNCGWVGGSGHLREVLASVSGKNIPDTPCQCCLGDTARFKPRGKTLALGFEAKFRFLASGVDFFGTPKWPF